LLCRKRQESQGYPFFRVLKGRKKSVYYRPIGRRLVGALRRDDGGLVVRRGNLAHAEKEIAPRLIRRGKLFKPLFVAAAVAQDGCFYFLLSAGKHRPRLLLSCSRRKGLGLDIVSEGKEG